MTAVQSDEVDRSTDSFETEAVELFQPSGKETSHLVHSWLKSACFVFRRLASNGSLPHWSVMFCPLFMAISATFGIFSAGKEVINLAPLTGIL